MHVIRHILITGWIIVFAGGALGGDCPAIQQLRRMHREKPFISLDFIQVIHSDVFETVDTLTGTLRAGHDGRFRLTMPGQEVVSNGILYWSYSVENQQVLVDSVADLGSWNPLTLLYDPERVYQCRSQETVGGLYELELEAIDSFVVPQSFILRVDRGGLSPKSLSYYDDNDSRIEVWINDFSQPLQVTDSVFEFHPGPGVEVIEIP